MRYLKYIFILLSFFTLNNCKDEINDPGDSQQNYEIVFTSNRSGNDEIYVMNRDGSNQTRLTNNSSKDWFPKWSRDGEKIAYLSERNGSAQLFVMNKDGTDQKQITSNLNFYPGYEWIEWSQDGTRILVQSFSEQNIIQIYIVNADGSSQVFLKEGNYPNWAGQNKIIYGGNGICSINSDGTYLTQITDGTVFDFCPVVSPQFDKIIFRSFRDNDSGKASLHIMNMDGSDIKELTKRNPIIKSIFSPNNADILIVARQTVNGYNKIFRININGNNEEVLVDFGNIESSPVYSSNGDRIIFSSLSDTEFRVDIYTKSLLDGTIKKLTNDKSYVIAFNNYPDWNPSR